MLTNIKSLTSLSNCSLIDHEPLLLYTLYIHLQHIYFHAATATFA